MWLSEFRDRTPKGGERSRTKRFHRNPAARRTANAPCDLTFESGVTILARLRLEALGTVGNASPGRGLKPDPPREESLRSYSVGTECQVFVNCYS